MNKTIKLLAALTLISSSVIGQTNDEKKTKHILNDQLDRYFQVLKDNDRLAGSIAIYKDGEPAYEKNIIVKEGKLEYSPINHRYKIGSISKTFTAVLIFQMIEEGKLSLDTKLAHFYSDIDNADKITIKQMLNHHSGIDSYTDQDDFVSYMAEDQTSEQMIKRIASFTADFEPGEKGEYSNSNYLLLGYILEQISGKSYKQLLHDRITKPYGLTETYVETVTEAANNEVFSYIKDAQWEEFPQWNMSVAGAAGAIVSTTEDLNQFFTLLFDGKIVSDKTLSIMIEEENDFGHGIFKRELRLGEEKYIGYWHNGRIENFTSDMVYIPKQKIGVATLINGNAYDVSKVFSTMVRAAVGAAIDIPEFKVLQLKEKDLHQYAGDYTSNTHPLTIKVLVQDEKLYAQASGQGAFPLTPIETHTFEFVAAGIVMTFAPDERQFVIKQGGRADVFQEQNDKSPRVTIDSTILESYVGVYGSKDFPLDITIILDNGSLFAQATGQSSFPLTAINDTEFRFDLAGIVMHFDATKQELIMIQGGNTTIMKKK